MPSLDRFFSISARGSTVAREVRGAVATFLTMAYILFVNPSILSQAAGMTPEVAASLTACTAAAAGVCCLAMGLFANFPLALASGMGLNAFVAFSLSAATGSWKTAMGLVVLDGLLILLLVLLGLREAVMHAIPRDLRLAIGAGIGLFIAFIGLVNGGLVRPSGIPTAPLTFGTFTSPATLVALAGIVVTAILLAVRVPGALLIGIVAGTLLALPLGVTRLPGGFAAPGFDAAFQADVIGALQWRLVPLLLSIMMVDFFDTLGTATAVAEQAGLIDEQGRIPGIRRILVVDSLSASVGGLFGASSVTSYVESAAGVAEGARTGLHTAVVGVLFLLAIFLAPIAGMVPKEAAAPALVLVGFYMVVHFAQVDFRRLDTAIPAFLTLVTIPLTFSISHGIGYGFILFVVLKLARLRFREVHPVMYVTALAFLAYFIWESR